MDKTILYTPFEWNGTLTEFHELREKSNLHLKEENGVYEIGHDATETTKQLMTMWGEPTNEPTRRKEVIDFGGGFFFEL